MKKKLLYTMVFAIAALGLASCSGDDESEGKSRITYYAILELNGEKNMTTQLGSAFADPGCTATMGGEDVSDQIVTSGSVDTNKLGFYTLNYSVVNPDGFSASASRQVAVVDKNNFASTYYGESQYGTRHYFNAPISISKLADGTYLINDILGGFYCYGRYPGYDAYGYDFFCEAVLNLNADNTISLVETGSWYFAQYPVTIVQGTYNPDNGEIELNLDFDGDPFYVKLTK